ncbi:MAG TPA: bifunctional riboflavin kinase/FAD synthetase [Dehalococcoidia bacterium]|nr:bifunctional riboflavin kinase/FAD synthetase [Dehalococcoidia bacterium]
MTVTLARNELRRIAPGRPTAVTIGVFDGVHRGHQHLANVLIESARREGLASVAVTFNPHPRAVLQPGFVVKYLTSLEERVELLQSLGIDAVGVLAFTSELAQLEPLEFLSLLVDELDMKLLVLGPDFAFGRNRAGTVELSGHIGEQLGFRVETASLLNEGGDKVGSTAVRQALDGGDVERVARLLGRPFSLRGPVVEGDKRGRELGFPTANIAIGMDRALPAYGIYVTRAYVREGSYESCTSIGVRPTFEVEPRPTIETFILDFDGDIYGEEMRIDLLKRLRGEEKFDSASSLIEQMHHDIEEARAYFSAPGEPTDG